MAEYKWFNSQGTLELGAEHYDAQAVGSEKFRNAARTDRINKFAPGLLDADLQPQTVALIQGGVIDEYELDITPTSWLTTIHGRDQMSFLLDYFFKTRYIRAPKKTSTSSIETDVVEIVGQFNASTIAQQAVAFAGLGLSWEVPDYELQEDFDAVGRVFDILKKLISPWTQVEPYRADIFIQNNVVIVRSRNPASSPDYTYSLTNFKRNRLLIRKRPTKKIGTVTLLGMREGTKQSPAPGGGTGIGNVWIEGEQDETSTTETFAPDGTLLSITTTVSRYKMPARLLTHQIKTVFTGGGGIPTLAARDTIDNDWEPVMIDTSGPVAQQKQISQLVTKEAIDPDDGVFKVMETEETGFDTDANGFTTGQTTLKKKLNSDSKLLENNSLIIKTMRDIGPLLVEQITEIYGWDSDKLQFFIQSRDTQQQGGHRPGGPGRGLPVKSTTKGGTSPGGSVQISLVRTFSTDPDAVDVTYSNINLSAAALETIMAQFAGAQNLWEYELFFQGVSMPWLRRANYLQINEMLAEDGITAITLPVVILTDVKTKFDMSKPQSESTQEVRAFGWRST